MPTPATLDIRPWQIPLLFLGLIFYYLVYEPCLMFKNFINNGILTPVDNLIREHSRYRN